MINEHELREHFRFATIAEKQQILIDAGMEPSQAFGNALIAESVVVNGFRGTGNYRQAQMFPVEG
jgi:hypothetical protein